MRYEWEGRMGQMRGEGGFLIRETTEPCRDVCFLNHKNPIYMFAQ